MYKLRDRMARESGMDLLVYQNPEATERGINPFDHGALHTDMWKTEGLKQALDKYGFDAAFGGARRDEEKSRAKERIFSFRTASHGWDPKSQRPELWNLYNARKNKGESIRVFPISNWTELDVWQYIHLNDIPIVPLYFADERPVVERDGMLIMVDDDRFPLEPGEVPVDPRNTSAMTVSKFGPVHIKGGSTQSVLSVSNPNGIGDAGSVLVPCPAASAWSNAHWAMPASMPPRGSSCGITARSPTAPPTFRRPLSVVTTSSVPAVTTRAQRC